MQIKKKKFGIIELDIDLNFSNYCLKAGPFSLAECVVLVQEGQVLHKTGNWVIAKNSEDQLVIEMETALGQGHLTFSADGYSNNISGIKILFEINLEHPADTVCLIPLQVPALSADHLLEHGRKMGGCRMLKFPVNTDFTSVFQTIISQDGQSIQLTHPLRQQQLSEFTGEIRGRQITNLTVSSEICAHGKQKISSESVSIFVSENGHDLMTAFGEREKTKGNKIKHQKSGWNSWDYYRWTITEDEVLKNAEFIKKDPVLSQHIKRITIDDGWQYCYGEWEANFLFPSGMENLAKKIIDMGFEPGLWFAPTIFEPHSRMAQVNSGMMARGISGNPCLAFEGMGRKGFLLDPTRSDSQEWLFDLFTRYVKMGYKFFKLDFLAMTLLAKNFFDPSAPRGEIIKNIITPIKAATDGYAELLGCNFNFEAGDELVDSVRISGDVHADWKCIKKNSPSIAARFWSQNRLWDNDPDFALCRGPQTSDDPALHDLKPCLVFVKPDSAIEDIPSANKTFATANLAEIRTLLGLVIISGGGINLSDNLCRLNDIGLDLLRRAVAAERGDAGVPLDLFESEYPSVWKQKTPKGYRFLLINWSNKPQSIQLDFKEQGIEFLEVIDFWTGEATLIENKKMVKNLAPHASYLGFTD